MTQQKRNQALIFIIMLGVVSLFADITYEGLRSIAGPYLATLGATGMIVGFVAGLGELIGYGVRLFSGYLTDKTGKYWRITGIGYLINFVTVPLLAFATTWQTAAFLILFERFGKAIRNPARDAMISFATKDVGRGWGFGVHNALDQCGALMGPLLIMLALFLQYSYATCFLLLGIPAICALIALGVARHYYPQPQSFEIDERQGTLAFSKTFWIYLGGVSCIAAGYTDFSLIAYHFQVKGQMAAIWIPFLYAIAMGVHGGSSLFLGRLFDYLGMKVLVFATLISSLSTPCLFSESWWVKVAGVILWGIGLGLQGTILRAIVALLVPKNVRGSAYGVLNLSFGVFWFLGSASMGMLYDRSPVYLVCFSVFVQLCALPFFLMSNRLIRINLS